MIVRKSERILYMLNKKIFYPHITILFLLNDIDEIINRRFIENIEIIVFKLVKNTKIIFSFYDKQIEKI